MEKRAVKENRNVKELSRIPQSLSFDNMALSRTFENESTIIRDLIVYIGNCKMKNLFNEVSFTIDEFCSEFNYNRTYLQRTMEEFKENPNLIPIIDGHKFDSVFEYSLYRALKENVIFRRKRDGIETFESVQIIAKLDVFYDKTTEKSTKRSYNVKLGNQILDYLFNEYNLIDYNEYCNIQTKKISSTGSMRNFYIFMARVISQVRYNQKQGLPENFSLSIDALCSIFGVNFDRPNNKKAYIKKTLENLLKEVKNLSFNWKFTSEKSKHEYFVEFSFPKSTIEYFDEHLAAVFYKRLLNEAMRWFAISKMSNSISFREKLSIMPKEEFFNWFVDGVKDMDNKLSIYKEVYSSIYGVEYKKNS